MKSEGFIIGVVCVVCLTYSIEGHCQRQFLVSAMGAGFFETRTASIYGPGLEERKSNSYSGSAGTRILFVQKRVRMGLGLSFVNRRYQMSRPFDYCHFNEPGSPCVFILAHTDYYRYQTLELPLSFDVQFWSYKDWTWYIGSTYSSAYILKGRYQTKIPDVGALDDDKDMSLFSTSVSAQVTASYRVNTRLGVNAQPFVRIAGRQHGDPILFESSADRIVTRLDSFGLMVEVQYRIGR